jgi:hypothetical protein
LDLSPRGELKPGAPSLEVLAASYSSELHDKKIISESDANEWDRTTIVLGDDIQKLEVSKGMRVNFVNGRRVSARLLGGGLPGDLFRLAVSDRKESNYFTISKHILNPKLDSVEFVGLDMTISSEDVCFAEASLNVFFASGDRTDIANFRFAPKLLLTGKLMRFFAFREVPEIVRDESCQYLDLVLSIKSSKFDLTFHSFNCSWAQSA